MIAFECVTGGVSGEGMATQRVVEHCGGVFRHDDASREAARARFPRGAINQCCGLGIVATEGGEEDVDGDERRVSGHRRHSALPGG